ncbi:MAG: hypothetical protein FWE57_08605 [Chitinispirillia bacterium]|nr:hypothetical protein [Chitinispirillia bacterium]
MLIAAILIIICLSFVIYKLRAAAALRSSALQKLKQELENTKPMRDLGESAAAFSHDIKNQMSAISGYATLLTRSKTIDDQNRKMAEEILQAAIRIQESSISALDAARAKAKGLNSTGTAESAASPQSF